ncbi:MAG: ribosome silencing factor [Actinobacteria bacterium]|nr:ribosome silencing factor [Actinomycetota bacterium]MTA76827.1 ribosome silencing factor [Actinomycetota bacterium]
MPSEQTSLSWVVEAARAAAAKTDESTVVLDVGEVLSITGWFVVTGGTNTRQVRTIAETVEEAVAAIGGPKPLRIEGLDSSQWILMDYGDFIVHVFLDETRAFYDLERLWRDVPVVDWT